MATGLKVFDDQGNKFEVQKPRQQAFNKVVAFDGGRIKEGFGQKPGFLAEKNQQDDGQAQHSNI